ncbi:hypothetical protein G8A07_06110 [Roseateles sp. DAIF2]|uniref:pilus assembly PilX family protein n=1 Tax=Roseateles sp. DAIF2 TaxID=2714952 RepID=UPI0018A2F9E0|nr:hypothetical protein [Roseateles sp. DAIF2]QPF72547.1 hypothetical protein G8A07_06110 [Roseateles sp. DAIF2]
MAARVSKNSLAQRGLSLLFALMALVVISLASVALIRSVDTTGLVIGNLGFKQDATATAGRATELAITWLIANAGAGLQNDNAQQGYYAASRDSMDPTGQSSKDVGRAVVDWSGKGDCSTFAKDSFGSCMRSSNPQSIGGNTASWVITRLCATEGNPNGIDCATPPGSATPPGGNRGEISQKSQRIQLPFSSSQYYRVVVRVQGPRGTAAFTEAIVQM